MLKRTVYICDRCGEEAGDVVYTLTCYAQDTAERVGVSAKVADQNIKQSMRYLNDARHLCEKCKDELTDGIFIV